MLRRKREKERERERERESVCAPRRRTVGAVRIRNTNPEETDVLCGFHSERNLI